jgi:very-short-patch-repair endonuclease
VIELDGYAYHSSPEAHRTDLQRANELMTEGWTLRRFTYHDLLTDPEGFVGTVQELLRG